MKRKHSMWTVFLYCMFFASGFAALIYEIVWVRLLTVYSGGSTFAVSLVLTVFMAGLAVGSLIAGRIADRLNSPGRLLGLYGLLEVCVGAWGIVFPLLLRAVEPLYAGLYGALHASSLVYAIGAAGISALVLLPATVLMGMTLPILLKYCVREECVGRSTGRLYGINTAGAAVGTLVCGFWLVHFLGVSGALWTAVCVNLVIGLICWLVGRFEARACGGSVPGGDAGGGPVAVGVGELDVVVGAPAVRGDVLRCGGVWVALGVSGFCAMGYEVVWTRLLSLLIGPTTYSFTIVLFAFILGLAAGSVLMGGVADRSRRPGRILAVMLVFGALLGVLASQVLGHSQGFFAKLLLRFGDRFVVVETLKALSLVGVILPPTLCFGAMFPLAVRMLVRDASSLGRVSGGLYTVNTVGAALGSAAAAFVLIPVLGKAWSISLLAVLQIVAAGWVWFCGEEGRVGWLVRGRVVVLLAVCLLPALVLPRWSDEVFVKAGYHRFADKARSLRSLSWVQVLAGMRPVPDEPDSDEVIHLEDGAGGFVAVGRSIDSYGQTNRFLSISGKADASSGGDIHTQVMAGHLGMLFHPGASNVMVLGLASGITAGEILHYPVARLDVLEISQEVVDACRYFAPWNNGILDDPRAQILLQDARTHLTLTDREYDLISCEPSNPWMAGLANLFTVDFFEKVRDHLADDGVFVQWVHSYQMDWESFSMVGRTVAKVFPNAVLFKTATTGSDYLFLCFKDPAGWPDERVAAANLVHARKSRNMSLPAAEVLYPLVVSDDLAGLFGTGPVHTDELPLLEFIAPKQVYAGGRDFSGEVMSRRRIGERIGGIRERFNAIGKQLQLAGYMASVGVSPVGLIDLSRATESEVSAYEALVFDFCSRGLPGQWDSIESPVLRTRCQAEVERRVTAFLGSAAASAVSARVRGRAEFDLGKLYLTLGRYGDAAGVLMKAYAVFPDSYELVRELGASLEMAGRSADALPVLRRLVESFAGDVELRTRLAACTLRVGATNEAERMFVAILADDSKQVQALLALGAIYGNRGDFARAAEMALKVVELKPEVISAYQNLAIALANMNRPRDAEYWAGRGLELAPDNRVLQAVKAQMAGR